MSKVKHIGLVKFKEGASEEQTEDLFNQLLDLSESIDGIEDYVSGPNCSSEGLSQGFTHGFVMTFTDAAARDTYLSHPQHETFKNTFLPIIDSIAVLDFEV